MPSRNSPKPQQAERAPARPQPPSMNSDFLHAGGSRFFPGRVIQGRRRDASYTEAREVHSLPRITPAIAPSRQAVRAALPRPHVCDVHEALLSAPRGTR